jgi:hypothetical protein
VVSVQSVVKKVPIRESSVVGANASSHEV